MWLRVNRAMLAVACALCVGACGTDDASSDAASGGTADASGHDTGTSSDASVDDGSDAASADVGVPDTMLDVATSDAESDAAETTPSTGTSPDDDLDGDGTVNRFDSDDDGDGLSDDAEQRADTDNIGCVWDVDCDGDGIGDGLEGTHDTDDDGVPDMLDLDSDDDGVPDAEQLAGVVCWGVLPSYGIHATDVDRDGLPNAMEGPGDTDGDGMSDLCDLDSDDDWLRDHDEVDWGDDGLPIDLDTDGDGLLDRHDLDSDGDGVPDEDEYQATGRAPWFSEFYRDPDEDGLPPWRDVDSDGDGRPDAASYVDEAGDGTFRLRDLDGDNNPDFVDLDDDGDELRDVYETGCPAAPEHDMPDSDGDGWEDMWEASFGLPMTAGCDPDVSPGDLGVERVLPDEWGGLGPDLEMAAPAVGASCADQRYELVARTWPEEMDPACVLAGVQWAPSSDAPCEGAGLVDTDDDGVVDAAVGYREGDTLAFTVPGDVQRYCIADVPLLKNGSPEIIIAALEIDLLAEGEIVATWRWAIESQQWGF